MSELGDFLELLQGAHRAYASVRGVVRDWTDLALVQAGAERWAAIRGGDSVSSTRLPEGGARTWEHTVRFWRRREGRCWRIEHLRAQGMASVQIINGDQWWNRDPDGTWVTNAGAARASGTDIHGPIGHLLDPASLIDQLAFEPAGRDTQAGRPGLLARGRVDHEDRRQLWADLRDWPFADDYELLADAEYGVLLRFVCRLDGQESLRWEVTEIAFNEGLSPELFEGPADALPWDRRLG